MAKFLSGSILGSDISPTARIAASSQMNTYKQQVDFGYPLTFNRKLLLGTRAKVGGTPGWVVGAADNLPYLATLPASQTGSKLVVPLTGLPIGATITGFKIHAQIESAGGTVTLDADLRAVTNVAAEPTDASIGTMTQVSVTADTAVAQEKTGLTEVVTSGKSYYLVLTGTTAGSTDIILLQPEIYISGVGLLETCEVLLFRAEKAGTITEVGAGLNTDGSSTDIAFDLLKNGVSMLTAEIDVTDSTGDGTEVAGTLSGSGIYASGDLITAKMTVTSAVGANGPWMRAVREEDGV